MSDSTLHILIRGPNQPELMQHMLNAIADGDEILLIEDGVYWSTAHFADHFKACQLYTLDLDVKARAVQVSCGEIVNDEGFVELCVKHARTVSWC